jgi:hypothetical protein
MAAGGGVAAEAIADGGGAATGWVSAMAGGMLRCGHAECNLSTVIQLLCDVIGSCPVGSEENHGDYAQVLIV